MKPGRMAATSILLTAAVMALAGCGTSPMTQPKTPVIAQARGEVFGGQQPVVNMTLELYDAGSSGYGSAATGLLSTMTDANGSFNFTNPACANGNDQLYLVGMGGDPVAGNAGNNTANNANLALMVALGNCSGLGSIAHIHMNELTTVAAVWALAPFMSGSTNAYANVGSSAGNAKGLQLAFAAAAQVANISTGTFPGTLPAGAVLPTSELNTIADIIEACVNSKGGVANDTTACGTLFGDTPNTAGNVFPTDTITAAMNIAQNPARNPGPLESIASATPTFEPNLGTAPNAWTVAIQYTGGGLDAPTTIATDQAGQVWVGNSGSDAVSLFDNLGNSQQGTTGTSLGGTPGGVAIDLSGNAWVTASNNDVYELSSSGAITGSPVTGLNAPTGVAVDPAGYIWVVNSGNSTVSAFNSSGTALSGSPFSGAGIASPAGIAINGNANASCTDCH